MAIVRVSSVNGGHGTLPYTSASSITVNAGDVLVVGVGQGSPDGDTVTDVTWNGGSQTISQVAKRLTPGGEEIYLYYLQNPTPATSTVTISGTGANNHYLLMVTYSGVKTSGQPSATSSAATLGGSLTDTITTVDNNSWTVLFGGVQTGTPAAGTGLTRLQLGDFGFLALFDSNGPVTPAGAYGQGWISTAGAGMDDVSLALSPQIGIIQTRPTVKINASGGTALADTITVSQGSTIVAVVFYGGESDPIPQFYVSDGAAYTSDSRAQTDGYPDNQRSQVFYRQNVTAGTYTVTASPNATEGNKAIRLIEVAGIGALDVSSWSVQGWDAGRAGTGANAVTSGATATTSRANCVVLGITCIGYNANTQSWNPLPTSDTTAGTGYTMAGTDAYISVESKSVNSIGVQEATFTQAVDVSRFTHTLVFFESGVSAPIAASAVAWTQNVASDTTIAVTKVFTAGASAHLFISCADTQTINTPTSVPSETWVLLDTLDDAYNARVAAHFIATNVTGGSTVITETYSAATTARQIGVKEITTTSGYDSSAVAHAAYYTISPGSAADSVSSTATPTLTRQPALISGFCINGYEGFVPVVGTGFTDNGTSFFTRAESKRLRSTTGVAATFSPPSAGGASRFMSFAAVFLETTSGADAPITPLSNDNFWMF